jgi:hypothetical protein
MKAVVGEEALSSEDLVSNIFLLGFFYYTEVVLEAMVLIKFLFFFFFLFFYNSYIWNFSTSLRGSLLHKERMIPATSSSL